MKHITVRLSPLLHFLHLILFYTFPVRSQDNNYTSILQPYQIAVTTLCVEFDYGVDISCGPSTTQTKNDPGEDVIPGFCQKLIDTLKYAYTTIDTTFNAELLQATRKGDSSVVD